METDWSSCYYLCRCQCTGDFWPPHQNFCLLHTQTISCILGPHSSSVLASHHSAVSHWATFYACQLSTKTLGHCCRYQSSFKFSEQIIILPVSFLASDSGTGLECQLLRPRCAYSVWWLSRYRLQCSTSRVRLRWAADWRRIWEILSRCLAAFNCWWAV